MSPQPLLGNSLQMPHTCLLVSEWVKPVGSKSASIAAATGCFFVTWALAWSPGTFRQCHEDLHGP